MFKIKSEMFEESSKSHASPKLYWQILIFLIVFLLIGVCEGIIPGIASYKPLLAEVSRLSDEGVTNISNLEYIRLTQKVMSEPDLMRISLISTVFGTLISMFYCRCGEMRSLKSMGVKKKKCIQHYFLGLLVGFLLISLVVLTSAAVGAEKMVLCKNIDFQELALFIPCWFLQGMSEEFIFRGYLMNTVGGKHSPEIAIAVSAAAFSLAHAANPGFDLFVFFNLALFGVFMGLYMLIFDDIWGACAIHSIWNCVQGNFYGISVSGTGSFETVFRTTPSSDIKLFTGGDFGIEGSIFTTIILLAASAVAVIFIKKKNASAEEKAKAEQP